MVAQTHEVASSVLRYDDEATAKLEAVYQHPDVMERRRRVRHALSLRPGERALDIGCGPGFLTAELAAEVGPDGWVCGIDISASGLSMARARAARQGVAAWTDYLEADATALPFPDGSFDAAVATQVYEYVADIPAAVGELSRILRPGGRAVVVDTEWDAIVWHATDDARMRQVLAAWDEHLTDAHLPRTLWPLLRQAGFEVERIEAITTINTEFAGYSHGLAALVAAYVPGRRGLTEEDARAWLADLQQLAEAGEYFFSLDQHLFLAVKPEA